MSNVVDIKEFKMAMLLQDEQIANDVVRVTREDLELIDARAAKQRIWLRELKSEIKELSVREEADRFSYYDLMFMKRSFKTCWTLYRAIMSDKAEMKQAYRKQDTKRQAA